MTITIPKDLGWGMQGMGEPVMRVVDDVIAQFGKVTYLEIGLGGGTTFMEIARRLAKNCENWRAIGVDVPGWNQIYRQGTKMTGLKYGFVVNYIDNIVQPITPNWNQISICLKDAESFLGESFAPAGKVHLALIDGCHGKQCVSTDFLLLEPMIEDGGVVMMHDIGQDEVGAGPGEHCGPLDVFGAANDLGLLNNTRPGWNHVETIIGAEGSAHMGVFQKTESKQ